jgi:hypothetical protein
MTILFLFIKCIRLLNEHLLVTVWARDPESTTTVIPRLDRGIQEILE